MLMSSDTVVSFPFDKVKGARFIVIAPLSCFSVCFRRLYGKIFNSKIIRMRVLQLIPLQV